LLAGEHVSSPLAPRPVGRVGPKNISPLKSANHPNTSNHTNNKKAGSRKKQLPAENF
jgi:hypothetical protein